jgi:hypothetical protein
VTRDVNVDLAFLAGEAAAVEEAGNDDQLSFEGLQQVVQGAVLVLAPFEAHQHFHV